MFIVHWFARLSVAGFCFVASCFAAETVGREKAIAIATGYMQRGLHFDIAAFEVSTERRTAPPADAVIPAERFAHHAFWLILFTPRKTPGELHFGDVTAVYVAADTGEVLGERLYR